MSAPGERKKKIKVEFIFVFKCDTIGNTIDSSLGYETYSQNFIFLELVTDLSNYFYFPPKLSKQFLKKFIYSVLTGFRFHFIQQYRRQIILLHFKYFISSFIFTSSFLLILIFVNNIAILSVIGIKTVKSGLTSHSPSNLYIIKCQVLMILLLCPLSISTYFYRYCHTLSFQKLYLDCSHCLKYFSWFKTILSYAAHRFFFLNYIFDQVILLFKTQNYSLHNVK